MDKKPLKYRKSGNSGNKNNNDLKIINHKINCKRSKIKPRNIFNNNKLFSYQKASGNIILLKKLIHQTFIDKYYHDKNFYNSKVIEDIINNESTHVVAEFKDYLIYGDDSEFFQKIYNIKESRKYLPKIFNYYESCSVIFPNYVILHESKYIYKNIQKKQKLIDLQQEKEDKLELIKSGMINEKDWRGEKNKENYLFNEKAIYSILGQTNTSNINKIFGINNDNKNENSDYMFNNIINKLNNIEEKESFQKKKINLIKKKCRIPSLNLNNTKGLMKQFYKQSNEKEKENNDKEKNKNNFKKKTYIIINKQNNNIKHYHIKKKSLSKKNDNDMSNLILNKKITKENKNFLTNENTSNNIYSKIPKSKLSIDLEGVKRDLKMKSKLNEQEIFSQRGISFFNDIIKKKLLKRKNSKNNTSIGKSPSKTRKKVNSFIPSQKQLLKLINGDNIIHICNSIKKKNPKSNQANYSSSSLVKQENSKKSDITKQKVKVPIIHIKDSNSSNNLLKNNNNLTHRGSIIRRRIIKKGSTYIQDNNYIENLTNYKEITSESNINININTLQINDREKREKKIYFTIAPHINNMINLNKIKYMMRTSSRENIGNLGKNEVKSYKNDKISKNKLNTKGNMVNKKNIYHNKNISIHNIKKDKNRIKKSYKSSNTQISSSIGTAACSYGKNSHLMDFETINVYQKRSYPYPNFVKAKNINAKKKITNNYEKQRKLSLSPDKVQSKELIKKILLNNPISKEKYNKNIIISKKNMSLCENNKKQKNVVLPIRKEKDQSEIKFRDMIHLILNNKNMQNNYGNISRNSKIKHSKEKSTISISNKTSHSINTNESIKKSLLSLKNSSSNNKNKKKHIFPNNKIHYGYSKNNK